MTGRMPFPGTHWHMAPVLWLAVTLAVSPAIADSSPPDPLARNPHARHRQVREQTQALIERVLDRQILKLEENGLTHLPIYTDISTARETLQGLIDGPMREAADLLELARNQSGSERDKSYLQARQLIRDSVSRLATERHSLLKRLRRAETTRQLQRLIASQEAARKHALDLLERPTSQQESLRRTLREDQRDVHERFTHFVVTLEELRQWAGAPGATALQALESLTESDIESHLRQADGNLRDWQFAEAAQSQQAVLQALQRLLKPLGQTDDWHNPERLAAMDELREFISAQQKLREQAEQTDLRSTAGAELADRQMELRQQIERYQAQLAHETPGRKSLEQAIAQAQQAAERLFAADRREALQAQAQVLEQLAAAAEQLSSAERDVPGSLSAAEARRQIAALEAAQEAMQRIAAKQEEVDREARTDLPAAAPQEARIAEELSQLAKAEPLPHPIGPRLDAAASAAQNAAKELAESNTSNPNLSRQALQHADRAIERASAEIQAALDDARRRSEGIAIGELSRAAETLERAAAAEREQVETLERALRDASALDPQAARALSDKQAEISTLARKIAAAIHETAPDAEPSLDRAAMAADEAGQSLTGDETPRESTVETAAQKANEAKELLQSAAADLRRQIADSAGRLSRESAAQQKKVQHALEETRQVSPETEDDSTADAPPDLSRLLAAGSAVQAARAAQERAAGRPQAARALEAAGQIRKALTLQRAAERTAQAAAEAAPDESRGALQAQRAAERATAEAAQALSADQAAAPAEGISSAAQELERAAAASAQATQDLLQKDPDQAASGQQAARAALEKALEQTEKEAAQSADTSPEKPDAAAQAKVSQQIAAAQEALNSKTSDVNSSLQQAATSSREALRQMKESTPEATREAQARVATALHETARKIDQALKDAARTEAQNLKQSAKQAGEAAPAAAQTDPAATEALRTAQDEAESANEDFPESEMSRPTPSELADSAARVQKQTRRAAAELAAREQRIARDRQAADRIAKLTEEQQQSVSDIGTAREQLNASQDPSASASSPDQQNPEKASQNKESMAATAEARRAAASQLAQARDRFAQTLAETGRRAADVAEQREIANPPLREALELVSRWERMESSGPQKAGGEDESAKEEAGGPSAAGETGPETASGRPRTGSKGQGLSDASFIPGDPDQAAESIAGAQALSQMAQALGEETSSESASSGQSVPGGARGKPGSQTADAEGSQENPPGLPSSADAEEASRKGGNGPRGAGAGKSGSPFNPSGTPTKSLPDETWLLKLSPELREAIRARANRPPPRGYEDRLRRYFESLN